MHDPLPFTVAPEMDMLPKARFCSLARRPHEAGKVPARQVWLDNALPKWQKLLGRCGAANDNQLTLAPQGPQGC